MAFPLLIGGAIALASTIPVLAAFGFKKGKEQAETEAAQVTKSHNIIALGAGAFLAYKFYKGR